MTLTERMVEAAAIARHEHCRRRTPLVVSIGWYDLDPEDQACMLAEAHASLTAALALAEAEGNALMPMLDPCETNTPVDGYNAGYNAHRAATLAGRVWP